MQNKGAIKFGTDGWRSIIAGDFTFTNVKRVAKAIADYYRHKAAGRKAKIVVGFDTRFLSDKFAEAVSEVLIDNQFEVILSDRAVPTPALSFSAKQMKCLAGIMITASHNPSEYNGIKIKTSSGGAAPVAVTKAVERRIPRTLIPSAFSQKGRLTKRDLTRDYVRFLRSYINLNKLKNSNFRVLVDAMYGSGNSFAAQVLKGTKIKLSFIRNEINPSFGGYRPEPVIHNLKPTMDKMKQGRFDLGLVLDGDADRIAAFACDKVFIHPQKILGLLALHLREDRHFKGGIVKTIAGSALIDNIARKLKLKLYETPVGFKYISDLMEKKDIMVGGEEAGGMGFKNYIPERDGTLAGLLLLEMSAYRRKPMLKILNEMEKEFGRYYYLREDLKLKKPIAKEKIMEFKKIRNLLGKPIEEVKDFDGVKLISADRSWLMLRASGTEPLVRVYAESTSIKRSQQIIKFGVSLLKKHAL